MLTNMVNDLSAILALCVTAWMLQKLPSSTRVWSSHNTSPKGTGSLLLKARGLAGGRSPFSQSVLSQYWPHGYTCEAGVRTWSVPHQFRQCKVCRKIVSWVKQKRLL